VTLELGDESLTKVAAEAPAEPAKPVSRRKVLRQYELVDLVRAYDPNVDEELLDRAYVFTMRAHGSQLRASGDPYYHHPVEVAGILAGLKLDTASIATGLLHDTVEDTVTTNAEIARLFGKEVARLVEGVTKLNKIELQSAETAQAENFRKLLLAMSEDIRVLLVKLADRLHNMRTLHFIKNEQRRKRIARETLEIYAPLAERIGMEAMKEELEDLAFSALWPEHREGVLHRLDMLRQGDTGLIERVCSSLRETLHKEGIEAEITGRVKTPYSIWKKMQNKNVSFEQLSDLMAFRVIVGTVGECYASLGVIHGKWQTLPGRFKDYISLPKPNGYRGSQGRDPDPHHRDARGGGARGSRALGLQGWRASARRPAVPLAALAPGDPGTYERPRGVPGAYQARDVPGPGLLLHAKGPADQPAQGCHPGRFRLCGPLADRRFLCRRQD
jgi:GTP pyrophosphokinase